MMSVLDQRLTLALAAAATVIAAPVSAEMATSDASVEFPTETAAIVAATSALFDAVEAANADDGQPVPVIRLPDIATKASVEATEDPAELLGRARPPSAPDRLSHFVVSGGSFSGVGRFHGDVGREPQSGLRLSDLGSE